MRVDALNTTEKKAAISLAAVFGLRMLGLFMLLPVFAIYGTELEGYSPLWVGIAIGAYGLTQAILQIPMGMLSDKFGRKPIILAGLFVFLLGSVIAANAETIYEVVFGRALQGMGAIASAILALAADLTREEQRPKVMATIGMFIGLSFTLAMVIGPIVADAFALSGLFWLTALLTLFAMLAIQFVVPNAINKAPKGDNLPMPQQMKKLISHPQLLRLNVGVFVLHMALTACFVVIPTYLVSAGLNLESHWLVYLPVLLGSFFVMVPFMIWAMKKNKEKGMFNSAIALLAIAMFAAYVAPVTLINLIVILMAFFIAFNYLEATMPSLLSRITPAGVKGSAMGIYSSSQFFGAFVGGLVGGWLTVEYNDHMLFAVMTLCIVGWFLLNLSLKMAPKGKNFSFKTPQYDEQTAEIALSKLTAIPGVLEATIVHSESVAYVKLNDKETDINRVKQVLS
ncbi:MFS transporter [Thalassotalea agarivorans]|uniref:Predicted arabinose efflux permease, MFS family n=1 Tax=Thalassotalea agarivorans TaxID=349064 RepID=A0A1I0GNE0_THASX|nr:MFS transporter [Thalassotalea agarivorans]SET72533.1 Predicted arabinose efflux permease, MFS family [Thalassotalea agarivorans]